MKSGKEEGFVQTGASGARSRRGRLEQSEQIWFVNWFRNKYLDYIIFHIPNGGSRNIREAVNLKAAGVLSGVPDLLICVAKKGYHGLFIEMKQRKDMSKSVKGRSIGKLSKAQEKLFSELVAQGYRVAVAEGCEQAKEITREYMKDDDIR